MNVQTGLRCLLFLTEEEENDMKNQVLTASGWLKIDWVDEFLVWNPADYGGIDELILFQRDVWLPDLFVENTAQNYVELGNDAMLISVTSDGQIIWEPGIVTETSCAVNIGKYPFDTQMCDIRYLTWMHTNRTLTVAPEVQTINLDAQLPNGEWDITMTEARPYSYPSTYRLGWKHTGTTFVVYLRRKRTFYILNTIIPVVMLSLLNVLVFILPADCGERMALAVTVLLSFTVYLGIISDNMPKTSESLSVLAVYLTTLLAVSTMSVCCAGLVLNIHHRDPSHPVPPSLRWLFIKHSHPSSWTRTSTLKRKNFRGHSESLRSNADFLPVNSDSFRAGSNSESIRANLESTRTNTESFRTNTDSIRTNLESMRTNTDAVRANSVESFRTHAGSMDLAEVVQDPGSTTVTTTATSTTTTTTSSFSECNSADHPRRPHGSERRLWGLSEPTLQEHPSPQSERCQDFHQLKDMQVVCETKVKVRQNGENEVLRHMRRGGAGGGGGGRRRELAAVPRECQRLMKGSSTLVKAPEVTWHEIGKSLDHILFWIFFIITNTITTIILVLFMVL